MAVKRSNSLKKQIKKMCVGSTLSKEHCSTDETLNSKPMVQRRDSISVTSLSTASTSSSEKPKCVSFHKLVNVRATLHANDMTIDEVNDTWYTKEELYELKQQPQDDTDDTRGLEASFLEGRKRRRRNVCNAINLVMDEQDVQFMNGENNPEIIRSIYLEVSWKSQAVAQHRAREDERFVRDMNEKEMMLR
mmetsp:Transcript_17048/g.25810  ORF Transcript_17048/g.25810 Transcript_17048/m.25810 type:complete len:191 (+) Transcript_17048:140-712(+)|eukprot:CAMPEP_0178920272 /NCGR_PEP_ID=MMETSP0786-20121207/14914_1 /TAXON_ID=186022 /ORGANISM="Thalassionema frauenfeldii, Strain CCMP 1798" /LENGTH=190 /DNA_ID=CAMNT_0020594323 /DNA_START=89 /DNA_END=661 /DNA_ORIENTATION=-